VAAATEDLMTGGTHELQSEFAKKYQAKGRAEGRAEALTDELEARGLRVPAVVAAYFVLLCYAVGRLFTDP
jgi:hypothetical protein